MTASVRAWCKYLPAAAWLAVAPAAAEDEESPGSTAHSVAALAGPALATSTSPGEEYRRHYREALANGELVEAETAAKQRLDLLVHAGGTGYGVMADALADLAHVQGRRELYVPAVANYEAAIALLEQGEDRLSASLVEPLVALAGIHAASGRPELALPVYERALHVTQVNAGPHTLGQVEILDAMTDALEATGRDAAALQAVDRMFWLYARAFSPDSEEVLPALHRKAELYRTLERYADERNVYREITRIIKSRHGEHDLSLLDVYSAMGRTYFHDLDDVYFRSEPTTETGETFLRRAVEVTEQNPHATWQMQQKALFELADYYTLRNVQDKARMRYRRAWELLSADEERLEHRRRGLERVVPLLGANLDPVANFGYRSSNEETDPADYQQGYVVARFTVNDRGRTTDIRIVDADPPGFTAMETRVRQAVRRLIFRPRYVDGEPVHTPDREFRHEFRYRAADFEAFARE